jgi:hypothetical protein
MVLLGASKNARGAARLINNVADNCGGVKKQGSHSKSSFPRVAQKNRCRACIPTESKNALGLPKCLIFTTNTTKRTAGIAMM